MINDIACPCGSNQALSQCCHPFIQGTHHAETAEALMRSRYSAYSLGEYQYLLDTRHPEHRELDNLSALQAQGKVTQWRRLHILGCGGEQRDGPEAKVEFEAFFIEQGQLAKLHEDSGFKKVAGRWYYTEGQHEVLVIDEKWQRNAPCLCGSGIKSKRCCMTHL